MTPLKTFSNAKAALHWNKSSCLLHTGQTERHHLLQLYKTNSRFSGGEGAQSPSELNHFPFCLGNYRALSATASLQLQNPRTWVLRVNHEGSEKPPWHQKQVTLNLCLQAANKTFQISHSTSIPNPSSSPLAHLNLHSVAKWGLILQKYLQFGIPNSKKPIPNSFMFYWRSHSGVK